MTTKEKVIAIIQTRKDDATKRRENLHIAAKNATEIERTAAWVALLAVEIECTEIIKEVEVSI